MLTKWARDMFGEYYNRDLFQEHVTRVDITPAARWFYEDNPQEDYDHKEDFPTLAPPWPATWMEFSTPNRINANGEIEENAFPLADRMGAYIVGTNIGDKDVAGEDHPLRQIADVVAEDDLVSKARVGTKTPEDAEWWVAWSLYVSTRNRVLNLGVVGDFLDSGGQLLFVGPENRGRIAIPGPLLRRRIEAGEIATRTASDWIINQCLPFEFAVSLTHCNNVELSEDSVPDPVQKKRRDSGKDPGMTFKCLELDHIKEKSRTESSSDESEIDRALHICRGHFKEYTEDNPLFGKHTGTYWWPMHVRGSKDAGEVKKSYKVQDPPNETD